MQSRTRPRPTPRKGSAKKWVFALVLGAVLLVALCVVIGPLAIVGVAMNQPFTHIAAISMVSRDEGWAIGTTSSVMQPGAYSVQILHLQHGQWTVQEIQTDGLMTDIDMVSPDEGWIASDGPTMLHYVGGAWNPVPIAVREIAALDMIDKDEGWAVGNHGAIIHYSNGVWQQVPSPTTQGLNGIAMVSKTEGWAVGGGSAIVGAPSVLLSYRDGVWAEIASPTSVPLEGIAMIDEDEGWAVGGSMRDPAQSVILHYQNGRWSVAANPTTVPLESVSMVSRDEGWAAGGGYVSRPDGSTALENVLLRYQQGQWQAVASPSGADFEQVLATAPGDGWLVGDDEVFRYQRGAWQSAR